MAASPIPVASRRPKIGGKPMRDVVVRRPPPSPSPPAGPKLAKSPTSDVVVRLWMPLGLLRLESLKTAVTMITKSDPNPPPPHVRDSRALPPSSSRDVNAYHTVGWTCTRLRRHRAYGYTYGKPDPNTAAGAPASRNKNDESDANFMDV